MTSPSLLLLGLNYVLLFFYNADCCLFNELYCIYSLRPGGFCQPSTLCSALLSFVEGKHRNCAPCLEDSSPGINSIISTAKQTEAKEDSVTKIKILPNLVPHHLVSKETRSLMYIELGNECSFLQKYYYTETLFQIKCMANTCDQK